ncbi:hypothetical protein D3C86_1671310 [compost metagenome]
MQRTCVRGLQHHVGAAAEQRVEAFHVADQLQVQRAGFDALHHLAVQAADVGVGQAALLGAEAALLAQQLASALGIAGEEYR